METKTKNILAIVVATALIGVGIFVIIAYPQYANHVVFFQTGGLI